MMSTPAGRLPAPTTLRSHLPQVGTWLASRTATDTAQAVASIGQPLHSVRAVRFTRVPEGVWFMAGHGSIPPLRCIPDTVNGAKTIRELYDKAGDTFGKPQRVIAAM